MGKSALDRLYGEEGQLFHLVIGHLLSLGLMVCAVLPTELIHWTLGPFSWFVYFLLNVVMFLVLAFFVMGKCDTPINKLVDLVERYIETPRRLQSGYRWLRKRFGAYSTFLLAFVTVLIVRGVVPELGIEEMGHFARTSLSWMIIFGIVLALLILASWVCGLVVGRLNGT